MSNSSARPKRVRSRVSRSGAYVNADDDDAAELEHDNNGVFDGTFVHYLAYVPDMFKVDIRHRSPKTRTIYGQAATVMMAIVVFYFVIFSSVRYANQEPVVVDAIRPSDYLPMPAPPVGIQLVYNNSVFYNESYFRFVFSHRTIVDFGHKALPRRHLNSVPCTRYWGHQPGRLDFLCADLSDDVKISGDFNLKEYNFLEYAVIRCQPSDPVVCANDSAIDEVVYAGSFNIITYGSQAPADSAIMHTQRIQLHPNMYQSRDMYFSKMKRVETRRSTFGVKKSELLVVSFIQTYFQKTRPYELVKLFMRLSPEAIERRVTPITFFDLVGSWAAVGSFAFTVLGVIAYLIIRHFYLNRTSSSSTSSSSSAVAAMSSAASHHDDEAQDVMMVEVHDEDLERQQHDDDGQ